MSNYMVPPKEFWKNTIPPPIKTPPPANFDIPYFYVAMSKVPNKNACPNFMEPNNGNKPLRNKAPETK